MKQCHDCGPTQEEHLVAYTSVILNYISNYLFEFLEKMTGNSSKEFYDAFTLPFLKTLVFVRIGKLLDEPDKKTTLRAQCFWEEAKKRGIKMQEFRLGSISDVFIAKYRNKELCFTGLPRPDFQDSPNVLWLSNKGALKRNLRSAGLPVARGETTASLYAAKLIFEDLPKPVVTKPSVASYHRHTSIGVNNGEALVQGFKTANLLSPFVVVEEELPGNLYRSTLIDGKVAGTVMRQKDFGDAIEEVTNRIHHENREMLEQVAKLLGDPLIGVDFVMEDVGRPWRDQRAGVIGATHLPAIDLHHYAPLGEPQNVAGLLWNSVFPESQNNWVIR